MGMIQVLNYGGGIQSVAICVLIRRGLLPRPDHIVIADTGYEVQSTWDYLEQVTQPYLLPIGLQVEIVSPEYGRYGLYDNQGGLLMPMHTATGQLRTFCSGNWKRDVVNEYIYGRYPLAESFYSKAEKRQKYRRVYVDMCKWIGFSFDEKQRATLSPERQGIAIRYPLFEASLALGQQVTRQVCRDIIKAEGLPLPCKSRCWFCPHQSNAEWRELRDTSPDEFNKAVRFDTEHRDSMPDERRCDSTIYLHSSRKPLVFVNLEAESSGNSRQCQLGTCFV
jgi:hypothetical protein